MKILIATGASGGHIFPALELARELKGMGHGLFFVSTRGHMENEIKEEGFDISFVSSRGVSTSSLKTLTDSIYFMTKAMGESFSLLKKLQPDIVVGFGGYGAFPVVLTAALLRYPTVIHEQNVIPGRANRILSGFVNKIAVSFAKSLNFFGGKKTVVTGCPVHAKPRSFIAHDLLKKFNLKQDAFTILIFGGSQGSKKINEEFLKTAQLLKSKIDFQVIHVTGPLDYEATREYYRKEGIPARVFNFLKEIDEAYALSNLVICRSGALTVFELGLFGLPAILIPYPHAGHHQKENAKILSDAGIGVMIEENELSAKKLEATILQMEESRKTYAQLKGRVRDILKDIFVSDAALRLAREVISVKK